MSARDRSHRTRVWRTAVPARSGFRWIGSRSSGASPCRGASDAELRMRRLVGWLTLRLPGFGIGRGMSETARVTTRTTTSATRRTWIPRTAHGPLPTLIAVGRLPESGLASGARFTPRKLVRRGLRRTPADLRIVPRLALVPVSTPPMPTAKRRTSLGGPSYVGDQTATKSVSTTGRGQRIVAELTRKLSGQKSESVPDSGGLPTPRRTAGRLSGTRPSATPSSATPTCVPSPSGTFVGCWFVSVAVAPTVASLNLRPSITSSPWFVAVGTPSGTSCGPVLPATSRRAGASSWSSATAAATVASPQPDSPAGFLSGEAAGCGAWSSPRTTQEVGQW